MLSFLRRRKPLLPAADGDRIVASIREAEAGTTGEVRVYVESHCAYMDAMDRAVELFSTLGMEGTERRNAVLVYMAVKDHQFAIFGDQEIFNRAGGPVFWEASAQVLRSFLKAGEIGKGLALCIRELGTALAEHFPADPAVSRNELPDEIVFGR